MNSKLNGSFWRGILLGGAVAIGTVSCGRETSGSGQRTVPQSTVFTAGYLNPERIGSEGSGAPWITDLTVVDLDADGTDDIVACEGQLHQILWLRRQTDGSFRETVIGDPVPGAAHVEASDLDQDGDIDLLVASMGYVPPSNARIGAVVVLENLGDGDFRNHVVLQDTYRVTDVQAGDLDGDGDLDLAVGKFGYLEGQVTWLRNDGDWSFTETSLLELAGTIHTPITDIDADGDLDVLALVSQDWEEIHCFTNDGHGNFTARIIHGSTNRDYGSSGLAVADVDRDGDPDLVYTNGDGFDYSTPDARPWHGVQWLENDGRGRFRFHRIGNFAGAYSPLVIDLDEDGDRDLVCVSGFNNWRDSTAVSLAVFDNDGRQNFTRRDLANTPTHLVVLDAGDLDGDGQLELVTGALGFYPPYERAGRIELWRR